MAESAFSKAVTANSPSRPRRQLTKRPALGTPYSMKADKKVYKQKVKTGRSTYRFQSPHDEHLKTQANLSKRGVNGAY